MNPLVVAAVLTGVVVAIKYRVHVSIALFAGGMTLLLLSDPTLIPNVALDTLVNPSTLFLMGMSLTVASFAELYRITEYVTSLGKALMIKLRNPLISLSLIPAVIGLMPVAGGALMSAPIVGAIGSITGMSEDLMIFTNVWFRHTIFLVYPISSLIVTVSAMTGYSVISIALIQAPVMAFMIATGLILTYRGVGVKGIRSSDAVPEYSLKATSAPLIVGITASILLKEGGKYIFPGNPYSNLLMPLGVFLGYLTLALIAKPSRKKILESVINWKVAGVTAAGYSIMFLQNAMKVSGASASLTGVITSSGIPQLLVEILLPGIFGFITGSTLTGIVITLSILSTVTHLGLASISLIYVSAYMMYIWSPAHLCLVYTAQYFRRPITSSYRYMIPATLLTLTASIAYLLLLR